MQLGDDILEQLGSAIELHDPRQRIRKSAGQKKHGQYRRHARDTELSRELCPEPNHQHGVEDVQRGDHGQLGIDVPAARRLGGEKRREDDQP